MKICLATNNSNKLKEIRAILGNGIDIISLTDIGCTEELPETQSTLEGNSQQKAEYVYNNYQVDCIADDTGLEIYALDGAPGVYSARYAGTHRSADDNMDKVLEELSTCDNRKGQFRTVITLILGGKREQFEGVVKGAIALQRMGEEGFGYDPIFIPKGYSTSFAQMSMEDKNNISHRGQAIQKLAKYLKPVN